MIISGGRSKTYYNSISCLEGEWNDMASSIVVEKQNGRPNYNQNDYVVFYNDCYAKGYSQTLGPGRYRGYELGSLKYNISSFSIYGNLRVRTYINNENLSGYSFTHDAGENCLSNSENDKIGSLIIEYKPVQPNYRQAEAEIMLQYIPIAITGVIACDWLPAITGEISWVC
jgi:hypothetical protein